MSFKLSLSLRNQYKARAQKLKDDAGNVLFIILLAVALFATLAYAITGSTRSGGGDASREQTTLDASRIVSHAIEVETAIQRMKISNGCTDAQISFENSIIGGYTNPNAPADKSCHVFHANGGGVVFKTLLPNASTSIASSWVKNFGFVGANDLPQIGLSGCGANCVDLHAFLWVQDQNLCRALNLAEGYGDTLNPLVTTAFILGPDNFIGSYSAIGTSSPAQFTGKRGGCYIWSSDPRLMIYYHVLLPR